MSRVFTVTADWDAEARMFTSQSDIPGLVIEAKTLEEFASLAQALALEVIATNLPDEPQPYAIRIENFWARIDAVGDLPFMPDGREQPAMLEDRIVFAASK
jgi:Domain of unknown function (DUF1902)